MPHQLDLIARGELTLQPESGRSEPRLWVKRFVIWCEPPEVTREIRLRPGLNMIWSPDPGESEEGRDEALAIGHGSGKTLFCRLLRYCLGEPHVAPEEQRHQIAAKCPEGMVGVEVMVDGVHWAVVRPIGVRRQHYAIRDATLEEIVEGKHESTGVNPLLEVLAGLLFDAETLQLMPCDTMAEAWQIALAWMTRDQECRFDKELDWRSADSDSGSPVRSLSLTRTLEAVRVLIQAITADELRIRDEIARLDEVIKLSDKEGSHRNWEVKKLFSRLAANIGVPEEDLPPGALGVELLRNRAIEQLSKASGSLTAADPARYTALANELASIQDEVGELRSELSALDAGIPKSEEISRRIEAQIPIGSAELFRAKNIPCPICEVPIDRVLAEGCKLSRELPDLEALQKKHENLLTEFENSKESLRLEREHWNRVRQALLQAQANEKSARGKLEEAERARNERTDAWYRTRRLLDELDQLDALISEQESIVTSADASTVEIESKRKLMGEYRDAQSRTVAQLSEAFDGIIQALLGIDATGKLWIDGVGLKSSVTLNGLRSTAAIDSLKVIAFDLAAMFLSIQGRTLVPAFFLHDSPREADLGLSLYHRILHFVRDLEQSSKPLLFQYIVTTTTRPPNELLQKPWLVETLNGTPESDRLLRIDL